MSGRAMAVVMAMLMTLPAGCGGDDSKASRAKPSAADVRAWASRFADCAKKSEFQVVVPKRPNERTDFLHQEGFEFAEVDLEEQPLLFFAAIVDFFPSRSQAARAKDRIGSSLAGPSTVQKNDLVVVHFTDDPGTPKRKQVEAVVDRCLRA